MITEILITILVGLVLIIYYWAYQRQTFWKRHNVPHVKSSILGHFARTTFLLENNTETFARLYNDPNAKGKPFVGINVFHKPAILIRSPELVKRILVKDFSYFTNRHTRTDPEYDSLSGNNLFQQVNPTWKELRNKLSPIFTSGKMKQMFYMVEKIGDTLNEAVVKTLKMGKSEIEIRTLFAMYTIDSISLVAFATESQCLTNPEQSEFLREAKNSFQVRFKDKIAGQMVFFLSNLMKYFGMKTFNPQFEIFLRRLFDEVMTDRIKHGGNRNDLIDALIAIKEAELSEKDSIFTNDILVAQAALFFFAGFETSSSTLEFFFYHMAKYPEIQEKVRSEIVNGIQKYDKMTYEMITNDLPYTTSAIKETLRMYPILPLLDRECVLPPNESGYALDPFSSFKIPQGMPLYIPMFQIQHDPEYFFEPLKFDPDRFDPESKSYDEYTYMPFGLGPRNCIGERFAMMQMRIAIVEILKSFRVETTSSTPEHIEFEKSSALLHSDHGILLKFVPI